MDGEDIVNIIVEQEATARFICRHIYNFFVADEPQVPSWSVTPPRDPAAVDTLVRAYFDADADIRTVMRTLFNADFFIAARFQRVKCPAELIAGTLKLSGGHRSVEPGLIGLDAACTAMGQRLMDPPTVEGWHTGKEWIDGGTLTERVNFAVDQVKDVSSPGPRSVIRRLSASGLPIAPADFVDRCLDLAGPLDVRSETRQALLELAERDGDLTFTTDGARRESESRIVRMLTLIVASREYQFA